MKKQFATTLFMGALAVQSATAAPILDQGFEDSAFVAGASLALVPVGDGTTSEGEWGNPFSSDANAVAGWPPHVAEIDNDLVAGGGKSLQLLRSDAVNFRSGAWHGRRTDTGLTDDFELTFYLNAQESYTGTIRVATRSGVPGEHIGLNIGASSTSFYGGSDTSTLLQDHSDTWHGFRFVGNVSDGTYDVYQRDGSQASPAWQQVNTTPLTFDNTAITEVSGLVGITFSNNPDAFIDDVSLAVPEPSSMGLLGSMALLIGHRRRGK